MPASAANSRRSGFTLVELTIVVLTIGILFAAAAPRFQRSLAYYRMEAAARRVANDIRYAQQCARKSCQVQSVAFSVANDNYTMPSAIDLNRRGAGFTVNLSPDYLVDILSADFGGSPTFQFDIFGRPSQAGSVVLQTGGAQRTIAMDSTGQVTMY